MSQLSIVPKQCAALTKKGVQCRKQAILGGSACGTHDQPGKSYLSLGSPAGKLIGGALVEAVLKLALEEGFKHLHRLPVLLPPFSHHDTLEPLDERQLDDLRELFAEETAARANARNMRDASSQVHVTISEVS